MANDRMSDPAGRPYAHISMLMSISCAALTLARRGYKFLTVAPGDQAVIDRCRQVGEARRNGLPRISSEEVVPVLSAPPWQGARDGGYAKDPFVRAARPRRLGTAS